MEDAQHLQFVDTCENIDAAVFTGDTLYNNASLVKFEEYLARWQRGVEAHKERQRAEAVVAPVATCATAGTFRRARAGMCSQHEKQGNLCHYQAACPHKVFSL